MEQKRFGSCLDPQCYERRQREALVAGWDEKFRKKWGTNGFRFERDFQSITEWGKFNGKRGANWKDVAEKCLSCEHFITILETSGIPAWEQACADIACYQKLRIVLLDFTLPENYDLYEPWMKYCRSHRRTPGDQVMMVVEEILTKDGLL
jgi:hypothetical protein